MYNEYYLNGTDQNALFDCIDDIEHLCKSSYDWDEDELNREFLSELVDWLQDIVDTMRNIVNEKGRNW